LVRSSAYHRLSGLSGYWSTALAVSQPIIEGAESTPCRDRRNFGNLLSRRWRRKSAPSRSEASNRMFRNMAPTTCHSKIGPCNLSVNNHRLRKIDSIEIGALEHLPVVRPFTGSRAKSIRRPNHSPRSEPYLFARIKLLRPFEHPGRLGHLGFRSDPFDEPLREAPCRHCGITHRHSRFVKSVDAGCEMPHKN
jgi:hypothetical protein